MRYVAIKDEILGSVTPIIKTLRYLQIDLNPAQSVIDIIKTAEYSRWDSDIIFSDGTEKTLNYLGLFSALSFCYWPGNDWHLTYKDKQLGGSYSLFWAMKKAIIQGVDITDSKVMKSLHFNDFKRILEGEKGISIPMVADRYRIMKEIGNILEKKYNGYFVNLFKEAKYDANKINHLLVTEFDCFRDEHTIEGHLLKYYKKSQEVISLIYEQFEGKGLGKFTNMASLTVSSDYKLPQILHSLGLIIYLPEALERIKQMEIITEQDRLSHEIRSATIYIGSKLSDLAIEYGSPTLPYQLSNILWTASQSPKYKKLPYPRIKSIWV